MGTAATLDFFAPSLARDERFRRWYARYERLALGPRMVRAVVASDFENDLRSVLPVIRVPTLVLHRAGNRFIDVSRGRDLARQIPGARFVELPGQPRPYRRPPGGVHGAPYFFTRFDVIPLRRAMAR